MTQPQNPAFTQGNEQTQPSVNQTAWAAFSDRDILYDCLTTTKQLADFLSTFMAEAGNEVILSTVEDLYLTIRDEQRNIFDLMSQKGWYSVETETPEKISEAFQQFQSKRTELES